LFMYPPVIKPGLENPLFLDDFPQLQTSIDKGFSS
jgi:hypothetical protein